MKAIRGYYTPSFTVEEFIWSGKPAVFINDHHFFLTFEEACDMMDNRNGGKNEPDNGVARRS
jgi:hypothetical protein